MSELKLCQGPSCHTYNTKDRLKGQKDNKTFQTRRRSSLYYGNGNFCDQRCLYDWISKYISKDDLDVRYVNKFLGLLAFEIWYRLFITKDMSANTTLN